MRVTALTGTALALFVVIAVAPASAEIVNLKTEAKGSNEVPPNQVTGSGSLTATFDTATRKLSWKGSYSGLTGPVAAAHFHGPAAPTQNAGVAIPINAAQSNFEGSADLTEAQAADLLAGRWYLNIHTEANKGGEIRGQMTR